MLTIQGSVIGLVVLMGGLLGLSLVIDVGGGANKAALPEDLASLPSSSGNNNALLDREEVMNDNSSATTSNSSTSDPTTSTTTKKPIICLYDELGMNEK